MEHRSLGALRVSLIGLGTNNFGLPTAGLPPVSAVVCDQARTTTIVRAALDAGVTFIDTAEEYALGEAESFIGRALGTRRDEAIVATKFGSHYSPTPGLGAGADRIVRSVEGSLSRLGTDRIDLLQLHFPDPTTPVDETLAAMDRLVGDGKVREVGCCNFTAALLDEAAEAAARAGVRPFASAQNAYSILGRRAEDELIPALRRHGMGLLPYWPLAGGVLTGKYRRGEPPAPGTRMFAQPEADRQRMLSERTFDRIEALEALAVEHGHTLTELALAWLASSDAVRTIIVGATAPEQVVANAACADWRLGPDELAAVDALRG